MTLTIDRVTWNINYLRAYFLDQNLLEWPPIMGARYWATPS
jgi:hypothetical protein